MTNLPPASKTFEGQVSGGARRAHDEAIRKRPAPPLRTADAAAPAASATYHAPTCALRLARR
jgi:hypothetical protein